MYFTTLTLESLFNMDSQYPYKRLTETNTTFDYEIALPGLVREDVDIKAIFEKEFTSIIVDVKKENNFVSKESFRIVKLSKDVSPLESDIKIEMSNGVLLISLLKTNPIREVQL